MDKLLVVLLVVVDDVGDRDHHEVGDAEEKSQTREVDSLGDLNGCETNGQRHGDEVTDVDEVVEGLVFHVAAK